MTGTVVLSKRTPAGVCPGMARILLVEDHHVLYRMLCEAIEDAGHEAECVQTKTEAEAKLTASAYDLVICDVRLPDGSGHDLASRAADLGIRTLLMTGHPDEATALTISRVAHLQKPFRLIDFITFIERNLP